MKIRLTLIECTRGFGVFFNFLPFSFSLEGMHMYLSFCMVAFYMGLHEFIRVGFFSWTRGSMHCCVCRSIRQSVRPSEMLLNCKSLPLPMSKGPTHPRTKP